MDKPPPDPPEQQPSNSHYQHDFATILAAVAALDSQGRKVKAKFKANGDFSVSLGPASMTEMLDNGYDATRHPNMARPQWVVYRVMREAFLDAENAIKADHAVVLEHWNPKLHPRQHPPREPKITKEKLADKLLVDAVTVKRMMEWNHLVNGRGQVLDTRSYPPSMWSEERPQCPALPCPFHTV